MIAQELRQPSGITDWLCQPRAHALPRVVDAIDDQVRATDTKAPLLKLGAQLAYQAENVFADRLGRADRLLEVPNQEFNTLL